MSQALIFDSLSYVKKMESAGFTRQQAEVQAEALREIITEKLVTKEYFDMKIHELDVNLAASMRELQYSLIIKLGSMIIGSVAVIAALLKIMR